MRARTILRCLLVIWLALAIAPGKGAEAAETSTAVTVPNNERVSGVTFMTSGGTSPSVDFSRIAADGANTFNITVWWEVSSSSSNIVAPGSNTISDATLVAMSTEAESYGLRVTISPSFQVGNGGWRGVYDPTDPPTFFSYYTQEVDHYAEIAQQLGMPMYWVGSEMDSTQKYAYNWEALIASVRQIYSGKLLYNVNWPGLTSVPFYGSLDAMGVSAYFPLSDEADPSLSQLLSGWQDYNGSSAVAQLEHIEQVWQKPIYFGEAGYAARMYAAQSPCCDTNATLDPELQYRCYEALLQTFRNQPWWGGVFWWDWIGDRFGVEGEPVESLIGTNSVAYQAPAGQTPAAAGATRAVPATSGARAPAAVAGAPLAETPATSQDQGPSTATPPVAPPTSSAPKANANRRYLAVRMPATPAVHRPARATLTALSILGFVSLLTTGVLSIKQIRRTPWYYKS